MRIIYCCLVHSSLLFKIVLTQRMIASQTTLGETKINIQDKRFSNVSCQEDSESQMMDLLRD